MCAKYWLTACPGKKVSLGEMTYLNMTIAVDWDVLFDLFIYVPSTISVM